MARAARARREALGRVLTHRERLFSVSAFAKLGNEANFNGIRQNLADTVSLSRGAANPIGHCRSS